MGKNLISRSKENVTLGCTLRHDTADGIHLNIFLKLELEKYGKLQFSKKPKCILLTRMLDFIHYCFSNYFILWESGVTENKTLHISRNVFKKTIHGII